MLQFRAGRADGSVLEFQSGLPHWKIRADIDQIFVEGVDNLFAGCLGNSRGRSIFGEDQRGEDQKDGREPTTTAGNVEGPHAAPRTDCLHYTERSKSSGARKFYCTERPSASFR